MEVFFYGLFMDEGLLATKGLRPRATAVGFVEDFALRIGRRATLVPAPGRRAYGAVMTVTEAEAAALYSEDSLADYRPEPVTVETMDGGQVEALCYTLPNGPGAGTNRDYAAALLEAATRLGLPADYLDEIKRLERVMF